MLEWLSKEAGTEAQHDMLARKLERERGSEFGVVGVVGVCVCVSGCVGVCGCEGVGVWVACWWDVFFISRDSHLAGGENTLIAQQKCKTYFKHVGRSVSGKGC